MSSLNFAMRNSELTRTPSGSWVVRNNRQGRVQEFRCTTEQQAEQLLSVLSNQTGEHPALVVGTPIEGES